jgi:hypothetical protein
LFEVIQEGGDGGLIAFEGDHVGAPVAVLSQEQLAIDGAHPVWPFHRTIGSDLLRRACLAVGMQRDAVESIGNHVVGVEHAIWHYGQAFRLGVRVGGDDALGLRHRGSD